MLNPSLDPAGGCSSDKVHLLVGIVRTMSASWQHFSGALWVCWTLSTLIRPQLASNAQMPP